MEINYNDKYNVGWCPCCDQGNLFVVKNKHPPEILSVVCEECNATWNSPETKDEEVTFVEDYEDATLDDIQTKGWIEYIYVLENNKWVKYTDKTKTLY